MDICYNYRAETGEYVGESVFRRDPIENMPMIPANATEIAPPEFNLAMLLCFLRVHGL
jgi:hypothetical protein